MSGPVPIPVLALNGSPQPSSRTHAIAAAAVELAGGGRVVDLGTLDAEGLLGRRVDAEVEALVAEVATAPLLVLATPIYRATYSGVLKLVFDQLPTEALADAAVVLAGTAAAPQHFLALDTGLRSLVASVGGWSAPTVAYGTPGDFDEGPVPGLALRDALARAVEEATLIATTRRGWRR